MPQIVTRVDAALAREVDALVEDGDADSRSDAVRIALRELLDRRRRARVAEQIVRSYEQRPQTQEEVCWSDAATAAMIAEEPW
jgi:Arc/MetJ-type ribon-helix-helix transcriptional regulator